VLAVADLLDVDGPGDLPDARIEVLGESGTGERLPHLGAEDPGERAAGYEEPGMGRLDPGRTVGR